MSPPCPRDDPVESAPTASREAFSFIPPLKSSRRSADNSLSTARGAEFERRQNLVTAAISLGAARRVALTILSSIA
jgi:hypothetical protein